MKFRTLVLTLFIFFTTHSISISAIYEWTDENGVTHYSNKKSSGANKENVQVSKETKSTSSTKSTNNKSVTKKIIINNNLTQSNTNSNVVQINKKSEIDRISRKIKHIEEEMEDARRRHYRKSSPTLKDKTKYREIIDDYNEELDELKDLLIDLKNQ